MARTVHGITLTGDNKKYKQVMKESEKIARNTTKSITSFTDEVNKGFTVLQANMNRFLGSLGKIGTAMRGMGGGMGGMGMLGMLSGIGAVAGLGAYAIGSSVRKRAESAGVGLRLNAIGAGGGFRNSTRMGYDSLSTLNQRYAMATQVGGRGGGLENIQALARVTGLDPETIISSASVRRNIGAGGAGGSLAAVRKTMSILSDTLGKTFDKGRLGSFMSSIDQTLMSMGAGVNIDEKSFIKSFGALMKDSTMSASPNRAAMGLSAIDQTFKTASGAKFGLVAQIMSEAMGGQASGVDLMYETRKGLFGKGSLGGGNRSQKIFGGMRKVFQDMGMGGSEENTSRLRALRIQDYFGIQGIDVARALGDAIAKGDFEKASQLSGKFKSPKDLQKEANEIMKTTDGKITSTMAILSNIQDSIGNRLIPIVFSIAESFGAISPQTAAREEMHNVKRRSLNSSRFMQSEGFNRDSASLEHRGNILHAFKQNVFNEEEKKKIRNSVMGEITEGKTLLSKTTNENDKANIQDLIEKLERLANAIDAQPKTINVSTQNGRGRTQDVSQKSIGQTK